MWKEERNRDMRALCIVVSCSFLYLFLLTAVSALALDPSKRITQYQHKMSRLQGGLLPHAPYWISQTTDGYLQVGGDSSGFFRFDGVRFVPWSSSLAPNGVASFFFLPSKNGGFWIGDSHGVSRVKGERDIAHFALPGTTGRMIGDLDGSLWTVRQTIQGSPICHVTDLSANCFGETEGKPFQRVSSILLDGKGGLWIGNDTGLAHWRSGHSEIYEFKGLRSNVGQSGIEDLARNPDGSLWVGIANAGPEAGLQKFDGRNSRPFVTRNFNGSKIGV